MIQALFDCCGTRCAGISVDGEQRVAVTMLAEPMTRADWTTHDYNVHFSFGLRNDGPEPRRVTVGVNGGEWDRLPDIAPLLYSAAAPDGPFAPARVEARTDLKKRYAMRLDLAPGQTIYLANTEPRSLGSVMAAAEAEAARGAAKRLVYGRSLDGRDLVAWRYGDPDGKGSILVTSGFHPPEPDTHASLAIMEWLAGDEGRKLTGRLSVTVVPVANPDGYARGSQGANAAGINFYWHFAREAPDRCPEAAALWNLAKGLRPRGYIDFHCYSFQTGKEPGPYVKPLDCYEDERIRAAAAAFHEALAARPATKAVRGFSTYAPHTLGAMLTARFDTVTAAKYHLHLKQGVPACREHGLAVFRLLAESLLARRLDGPAPGRRGGSLMHEARVLWAGLLRPSLGLLRRGRLAAIRIDRTGLDRPDAMGEQP